MKNTSEMDVLEKLIMDYVKKNPSSSTTVYAIERAKKEKNEGKYKGLQTITPVPRINKAHSKVR
jgi:hypothetical protein